MKEECREIRSLFDGFLDGDLSGEELFRVQKHMEVCEGCRFELSGEQEVVEMLGSLPERQCPKRVLRGIREAVGDLEGSNVRIDEGKSPFRSSRRSWVAVGLAAAIVAYLLIRIPLTDRKSPPQVTDSPEAVRQAWNEARWSLAFTADKMGRAEKDAIEAVLHERLPSTLRKGISSATQPTSGGTS